MSTPPVQQSGPPATEKDEDKSKGPLNSFLEFVLIVVVALGLALGIQAFLVKPFRIPSGSMEPTLNIGQRVLVDRVTGHFTDVSRGDVIVFHPPAGSEENASVKCGAPHRADQPCPRPKGDRRDDNFIKRVVAVGGDRLKVVDNRVYINGKRQKEPFARTDECPDVCNLPEEIKIPAGHFFMMGDNRGGSDDSRVWGPIPEDWIVGNAFFTYWPPKRIGTL